MLYSISGGLKPIEVESKNNLPIGTVLKMYGYSDPSFVITANRGVNERYPYYGATYETINLDSLEYGQYQANNLNWPEDGRKGIHTEITNKILNSSEIEDIKTRAAQAKIDREEKARLDAIETANTIARLKAEYSYLTMEDRASKLYGPTLAASNIRIELKRTFPGMKFTVKTEKYSGGNSVNIGWTDGPTEKEVREITRKYEEGSFNGMEDIYEYDRSNVWPGIFGGAKYVSETRHYSNELIEKCAEEVGVKITWDQYNNYQCEGKDWQDQESHRTWLRRKMNETSAYIKPEEKKAEPKAETESAESVEIRTNEEKNGIEIKFPSKPNQGVIDLLKLNGWRWSRFNGCWYNKNTEQNRLFARNF